MYIPSNAPIVPIQDWRVTPPSLVGQIGCSNCTRNAAFGDASPDPGISSGLKILGVMAFAAGALWVISKGMKPRAH